MIHSIYHQLKLFEAGFEIPADNSYQSYFPTLNFLDLKSLKNSNRLTSSVTGSFFAGDSGLFLGSRISFFLLFHLRYCFTP